MRNTINNGKKKFINIPSQEELLKRNREYEKELQELTNQINILSNVYLENQKLPHKNSDIKQKLIIKSKTAIKYVVSIDFKNQDYNQVEDSDKMYKGELRVKVNE